MAFYFEGENPPACMFQELGSIGVFEDVDWKVFFRPGSGRISLMVAAQGRAKNKANYRGLPWDGSKLLTSRDTEILKEHRGEMYRRLVEFMLEVVPVGSANLIATPGRKREGVTPEGDGWSKIGEVMCDLLGTWHIHLKSAEYETKWVVLKVVADEPAMHKANYNLKWNGERFAGGKESDLLVEYKPELCERLIEKLKELRVTEKCEKDQGEVKSVDYINLGSVGFALGQNRELLLVEDLSNPNVVTGRLTTPSQNGRPTDITFRAEQQPNGEVKCEGRLYEKCKEVQEVVDAVDALLKQHFFEKELYS